VLQEGGKERRLKVFPPVEVLDAGPLAGEWDFSDGRLAVGCGQGALRLTEVQPEGARRMKAEDYLRGRK